MKKLLVFLLFFISFSSIIMATDFSWKGEIRTRTTNYKEIYGTNVYSVIDSRARFFFTSIFSENLKAVVGFEIGDFEWGDDNHNADYENVETKNAYLEFAPDMINMLTFRVGLQTYVDQFGSAVFDEDAAGIMIMPEFESFNMNAGVFVLEDFEATGYKPETFAVFDISKEMGDLSLKGSFYYDTVSNSYSSFYLGAGADYMINDNIKTGGHFLYMSQNIDPDMGDYDSTGYFAYLYGQYTADKFDAKLNFGYIPGEKDLFDDVYFSGVEPYPYLYGLEYFFMGSVNDSYSLQSSYGSIGWMGFLGSMVISANINYDFLFLNAGLVRVTAEHYEKSLGTEIDFGIDYDLTEKLNFKAVYALFMLGDFYETHIPFIENDSVYELSTQLIYKF